MTQIFQLAPLGAYEGNYSARPRGAARTFHFTKISTFSTRASWRMLALEPVRSLADAGGGGTICGCATSARWDRVCMECFRDQGGIPVCIGAMGSDVIGMTNM